MSRSSPEGGRSSAWPWLPLAVVVLSALGCLGEEPGQRPEPALQLTLSPSTVLANVDGIYRVQATFRELAGVDVVLETASWELASPAQGLLASGALPPPGEIHGHSSLLRSYAFQFSSRGYVVALDGELRVAARGRSESGNLTEVLAAVPLVGN